MQLRHRETAEAGASPRVAALAEPPATRYPLPATKNWIAAALTVVRRDRAAFCALSLSFAVYALLAGVWVLLLDGGISEADEWGLYVVGGPLAFALGMVAAGVLLRRLSASKLSGLLAAQVWYWPLTIWGLRLAAAFGPVGIPGWVVLAPAVVVYPVMCIFVGRLAEAVSLEGWAWRALPWAAGLSALAFVPASRSNVSEFDPLSALPSPYLLAAAAVATGIAYGWLRWLAPRFRGLPGRLADGFVIVLLAPAVIDPLLHFDQHSHNFYLGPINDLLQGRVILVDVFSQYGVLPLVALAGIFGAGVLSLSYESFSLLLSLLLVGQFALLYVLLRHTLRSEVVAGLGLLTMLLVNLYGQAGLAQFYPSTGPIRFGLTYLLLAVVLLRYCRPRWQGRLYAVEAGLVALTAVWSVETFFYTALTYGALLVYEAVSEPSALGRRATWLAQRVAMVTAGIAGAHALLALAVYAAAGVLPDWGRYFGYFNLYLGGQFGMLPVQPWSGWPLVLAPLVASLLAALLRLVAEQDHGRDWRSAALLAFSVYGLAQFSYFVGRSHPNNLYHIAIPSLFLAWLWLDRLAAPVAQLPAVAIRSARYAGFSTLVFVLLLGAPDAVAKAGATMLGNPTAVAGWAGLSHPQPTTPQVSEAVRLLARLAPGQPRVAVFLEPELTTEVYLLSGRSNVFPSSHPGQDVLAPIAWSRILAAADHFRAGDSILLAADQTTLNALQAQMLAALCQRFSFTELERGSQGVAAVRLDPLPAGAAGCVLPVGAR